MGLTYHPAVRQFLALGFSRAHKQAPYGPKTMLSLILRSAQRYTCTCMSSVRCEDGVHVSADSSCLSFTAETCGQTRLCCGDVTSFSLTNPLPHAAAICMEINSGSLSEAGLLPPYRELVSSESPCDWLPTTVTLLLPRINVLTFHGQ